MRSIALPIENLVVGRLHCLRRESQFDKWPDSTRQKVIVELVYFGPVVNVLRGVERAQPVRLLGGGGPKCLFRAVRSDVEYHQGDRSEFASWRPVNGGRRLGAGVPRSRSPQRRWGGLHYHPYVRC